MSYSNIGRLAADPEIKFFESGRSLCEFTLAIDSPETVKSEDGRYKPKTVWLRCKAWSNNQGKGVASVISDYCNKGDQIFVNGELIQDEWIDKATDAKRREIKLNVTQVKLLSSKQSKPSQDESEDDSWADDPKPVPIEPATAKRKEKPNAYASTASKGKALAYADGAEELKDVPF